MKIINGVVVDREKMMTLWASGEPAYKSRAELLCTKHYQIKPNINKLSDSEHKLYDSAE